jgi:recombination protein RecA
VSLNQIKKELAKKGIVIKSASEIKEDKKIRTGIPSLDYVLDGGISQTEGGHRIEFWGKESTCKTSFALKIIKKFQEEGKECVFVDAEKSFDATWADMMGVNIEKLVMVYPNTLEEFGDIIAQLVPAVDLIVVDSIVSLIPEEELNRETNQPTMALGARINALITRKIYNAIGDRNPTLIFINQLREKVGVMYGNPNTSGGGHALLHFYNTRIEFKLGKPIEKEKERVGYTINLRCIKNKRGRPYRQASVDVYFDGTIDNKNPIFSQAVKYGIITRSGAWFEYGKLKEQGQEKMMAKLTEKDYAKIEEEIWKCMQ